MNLSTNLPCSKIIMTEDYVTEKGDLMLPAGLILSIRSLELTIHRKNLKLLAIRNKNIVEKLYEGINSDYYQRSYLNWRKEPITKPKSYSFHNNFLQHFFDNAKYKDASEIYNFLTQKPQ